MSRTGNAGAIETYACFTNTHNCARRHQVSVVRRESRDDRSDAPQKNTEGDGPRTRAPVAQRTEYRRRDHIDEHEGRRQQTDLAVRTGPKARLFRSGTMPETRVTIEVIQQIDEREHAKRDHRRPKRSEGNPGKCHRRDNRSVAKGIPRTAAGGTWDVDERARGSRSLHFRLHRPGPASGTPTGRAVARIAPERIQLQPLEILPHAVAEALTAGNGGAPRQHENEIPSGGVRLISRT